MLYFTAYNTRSVVTSMVISNIRCCISIPHLKVHQLGAMQPDVRRDINGVLHL